MKKIERLLIPTHNRVIENVEAKYLFYINDEEKIVCCYKGRKRKPSYYLRFKTLEQMNNRINEDVENWINDLNREIQVKENMKKQNEIDLQNLKVGDIFSYSWGYDQTNVNFYQVVKKVGKSTVQLIPIYGERDYDNQDSGTVIPRKNDFAGEETITKRIKNNSFKMDYGWANKTELNEKHYFSTYA